MGNALSHKLEVNKRRSFAFYYILTTGCHHDRVMAQVQSVHLTNGDDDGVHVRGMLGVCHKNDDDDANSETARRSKGVFVHKIPPRYRLFVVMFHSQIESIPLACQIAFDPCEKW